MVTFSMIFTDLNSVFKVRAFLKSNKSNGQSYYRTVIGNHNIIWNGNMFSDLDSPLNVLCSLSSIAEFLV